MGAAAFHSQPNDQSGGDAYLTDQKNATIVVKGMACGSINTGKLQRVETYIAITTPLGQFKPYGD
jgi:hypothetical protein